MEALLCMKNGMEKEVIFSLGDLSTVHLFMLVLLGTRGEGTREMSWDLNSIRTSFDIYAMLSF